MREIPKQEGPGILGKYAERQQQKKEKFIFTEQYLLANGY
jgi:hypothetical protein